MTAGAAKRHNDFAPQLRPIKSGQTHHNARAGGGSTIVAKPLPPTTTTPQQAKPPTASVCWAALRHSFGRALSRNRRHGPPRDLTM